MADSVYYSICRYRRAYAEVLETQLVALIFMWLYMDEKYDYKYYTVPFNKIALFSQTGHINLKKVNIGLLGQQKQALQTS